MQRKLNAITERQRKFLHRIRISSRKWPQHLWIGASAVQEVKSNSHIVPYMLREIQSGREMQLYCGAAVFFLSPGSLFDFITMIRYTISKSSSSGGIKMESLEPKKLALLRIWQILKQYSD